MFNSAWAAACSQSKQFAVFAHQLQADPSPQLLFAVLTSDHVKEFTQFLLDIDYQGLTPPLIASAFQHLIAVNGNVVTLGALLKSSHAVPQMFEQLRKPCLEQGNWLLLSAGLTNPRCPAALLYQHYPQQAELVLANPNCPQDLLQDGIAHYFSVTAQFGLVDTSEVRALLRNPSCPSSVLEYVALEQCSPLLMSLILANPQLQTQGWFELPFVGEKEQRSLFYLTHLAANPLAPADFLTFCLAFNQPITTNQRILLLKNILGNPNCPAPVLLQIALEHYQDVAIMHAALKHRQATRKLLALGTYHGNQQLQALASLRQITSCATN